MSRWVALATAILATNCAHRPAGSGTAPAMPPDILACLPQSQDLEPLGEPAIATDEASLFAHINGGAAKWIELGFSRAVFHSYRLPSTMVVSVDLVEMASETSAQALYESKANQASQTDLRFGQASAFAGYYLVFRYDRYCVTVAGADPDGTTKADLHATANEAVKRLAGCLAARE